MEKESALIVLKLLACELLTHNFIKFVDNIINASGMERIVLEVDDQMAKEWRNTSAKLRAEISKNLEQALADSLKKSKKANFELLLRDARKEAAQNGLTEEILDKLLNEDN